MANAIVARLTATARCWTTPQVVNEFYSSTTRPRAPEPLLTPPEAVAWIEAWLENAHWLDMTQHTSREALRAAFEFQMHIYDAQIWAVARIHNLAVLSEDAQSRPVIEGVVYVNPFAPSFKFSDLDL
jgi:predicted nucleic acid-binding protein